MNILSIIKRFLGWLWGDGDDIAGVSPYQEPEEAEEFRQEGRWVMVDGKPAHFLVSPDVSQETMNALAELVRAAHRHLDEHDIESESDQEYTSPTQMIEAARRTRGSNFYIANGNGKGGADEPDGGRND